MARAKPVSDHVTVRVLGAAEITVGSRRIGMGTEALFALALYVTTRAGERVPREDVLETFWPGGEDEARRHAMRQMFYRLRQKGFAFEEDGDCLRLDPGKVDSDLRTCLTPTWPESATAEAVDAALNVGPTFSARLPAPFLEWFDGVRNEVSHQARKAAMQLIATCRSQGRWADLDRWGKAVLATDPLHEEATLARAEAAAMTGAKTLALEILDGYLAEVGTADASVGKPAQQLRKRIAERRASWIPTGPREVALIGREEEMSVLTQAVESALLGKSRSVLLVGPSGYGKSRLLAEAREYAALRGVRCVAVRAEAITASQPLYLVQELARALNAQPGAAGITPNDMETIRSLIRADSGTPSLSFVPATTLQDIRRCLLSLAVAVSEESRLLVTIDDVHYCDEISIDIISAAVHELQESRCSCIAAGQPRAMDSVSAHSHGPTALVVSLPPLSQSSSQSLAAATARAHNRDLSPETLSDIARRSGGHPLFARELALAPNGGVRARELPTSLSSLVARSLSSQPPHSLKALRAIALLSDCATVSRVRKVSGLTHDEFLSTLDDLARGGLVHLDHARTLILHDAWKEAVLSSTPDAVCAALALDCIELVSESADGLSAKSHLLLAQLHGIAGESGRQIEHLLQSVDGLLASGLYDSALAATRAHAGGQPSRSSARFKVREALCLLGLGEPDAALGVANAVWRSRILQAEASFGEHVLAVCVAADCHIKLDRADNGPAAELLSIARNPKLAAENRARACLWGIRMVSNSERVDSFSEFAIISRSLSLSGASASHAALVELIFAAESGTLTDISAAQERLRQVDQGTLTIWDRCLLLRCSAHAHRIAGSLEEAAATATSAYDLAKSHGLAYAERLSAELICNLLLDFDRTAEACEWYCRMTSESPAAMASTKSAIGHVRDRLEFARGDYSSLAERVQERLKIIGEIGCTHGRASELALAAAVLAKSGRIAEAVPVLQLALDSVSPFLGRHAADLAVDMCIDAALMCADAHQVQAVGVRHVQLRAKSRGLSIAPGFRHLGSLLRN